MSVTWKVPAAPVRRAIAATTAAPVARTAIGLGILGALVSMIGSWIPSLWGDEAASLLSAERPLSTLFPMLGHVDAVHGSYYLGLHFWIRLFGTSPFAFRLPSALAIGACVAAIVLIGTRLDSLTFGVVAGIVCTVLPRVTYMGEEARSYAFSAAVAAWLTVLLLETMRKKGQSRGLWIGYGALLAVGTYLFLYLALIAVAHGLILLASADRRVLLRRWLLTAASAAVLSSPLIVFGILESHQISYLSNTTQLTFSTVAVSLWFSSAPFAVLGWALIWVTFGIFVLDWRAQRARLRLGPGRLPSPVVVGAVWLFVPSALLIGSHFLVADFTARYLSMCAPAAALLIAFAVLRIAQRRVAWLALGLAVVVGFAAPVWIQQRGPYSKNNSDWAEISSKMSTLARPGDAVVFDESVKPSRLPRLAMRTYPAGFTGLKDLTLKTPYSQNTTWHDSAYSIDQTVVLGRFTGVHTVWLVEYATPGHVDGYGVSTLASLGFHEGSVTHTYRSAIIEFTR